MRCSQCGEDYEDAAFCPRDGAPLLDADGVPVDPLVGRTIDGRYRIERRIGAGGFGVVYAAHQLRLDRAVAVKVLPPEAGEDPGRRRRFFVEARAISRLASPHTVRVHDFGETDDGLIYLVMELLTGEPLDARLRRGPLSIAEALDVAAGVCVALSEAHGFGIVHRDIKPGNIFLHTVAGEPTVRVLDFGVARLQGTWRNASGISTSTGAVIGTPAYMAPEQALGEAIDGRTDLYAVGVALFEMIAGERPLVASSVPQLLLKHVNDPRPSLRRHRPDLDIPPAVDALTRRLMARSPQQRPATANEARALIAAARSALAEPSHAPAGASHPLSAEATGPTVTLEPVTVDSLDTGEAIVAASPPTPERSPVAVGRGGRWWVAPVVALVVVSGFVAIDGARSGASDPATTDALADRAARSGAHRSGGDTTAVSAAAAEPSRRRGDGSGPVEAGPVEAGPVDASPVDAGPVDASPADPAQPTAIAPRSPALDAAPTRTPPRRRARRPVAPRPASPVVEPTRTEAHEVLDLLDERPPLTPAGGAGSEP